MAGIGSLTAEEAEMIRFMRASKAANPLGVAPSPPVVAEDAPRSHPSSPVEDPSTSARSDGDASLVSDDALLSLDVDAAVAAAAPAPPASTSTTTDSITCAAGVTDDDNDDGDLLDDDDFMAELLDNMAEQPPDSVSVVSTDTAPAPSRSAVTFAAGSPQVRQPRVAVVKSTSGSGGILRRREPSSRPPVAAEPTAVPREREDVETSSRLRLQDGRTLDPAAMRGLTAAHPYHSFKEISRQVHDINGAVALSEKNWCTIGVVTHRSEKKPTKSGGHFRTLHFTDMGLKTGTSVCVLLIGDACKNVRVHEGGVYALLEPEIQQERRQTGTGFILVAKGGDSVHFIGRSKDFIPCRAVKKDNTPCGNFVDRRIADLCTCHQEQAFNALKTDRMNLNNQGLSCSRQIHQRREDLVRARTHGGRLPANRLLANTAVAAEGSSAWKPRLGEKSLSVVGATYEVGGMIVQPAPGEKRQGLLTTRKVLQSQDKVVQKLTSGQLIGPGAGFRRGPKMMEAAKLQRKRKAEATAKGKQLAEERKRQKQADISASGLSAAINSRLAAREEKVFGCGGNHGTSAAVRLAEAKRARKATAAQAQRPGSSDTTESGAYLPGKFTNGTERAGAIGRSAAAKWQQKQDEQRRRQQQQQQHGPAPPPEEPRTTTSRGTVSKNVARATHAAAEHHQRLGQEEVVEEDESDDEEGDEEYELDFD